MSDEIGDDEVGGTTDVILSPGVNLSEVDVVLGLDANLPKMDTCHEGCCCNPLSFCKHRFNFTVFIRRYNTKSLQKLKDSKIVLDFFTFIEGMIEKKLASFQTLFVIVTKDKDFLLDAEKEFNEDRESFGFIFSSNHIRRKEIKVYVMNVNPERLQKRKKRNRKWKVHNQKKQIRARKNVIRDLRRIIFKMNKLFRQFRKKSCNKAN